MKVQHEIVEVELECIEFTCGHDVWLSERMANQRRRDHQSIWCPLCGITNVFKDESDVEAARRQRDEAKKAQKEAEWEAQAARNQARAIKAANTKLKKRISAGVCPCCHRSFKQLRQHMARMHPDYSGEDKSQ